MDKNGQNAILSYGILPLIVVWVTAKALELGQFLLGGLAHVRGVDAGVD